MKNLQRKIFDIYFGVPTLAKKLLVVVSLEHLVAAFCLNIAAYFKKVGHLHYDQIGQFISMYYWGCLFGALLGGVLTLKYRTTKISGYGLVILGVCLMLLFESGSYLLT